MNKIQQQITLLLRKGISLQFGSYSWCEKSSYITAQFFIPYRTSYKTLYC